MNLTEDSLPFITGMGFRKKCDLVYDEFHKCKINDLFNRCQIFIKTDLIHSFYTQILSKTNKNIIIFTHNSDLNIDNSHKYILECENLIIWYAQNVNFSHSKLKSIPIGIANKRWIHGNINKLSKIMKEENKKDNLVYCRFSTSTNTREREKCKQCIQPYKLKSKIPFEEHLRELSKSYFCVSPNGNGIDCHRHWECFYLKTIPIVTQSPNISYYTDYPFLVIKDWNDFKNLNLSPELYYKIWSDFDSSKLYI